MLQHRGQVGQSGQLVECAQATQQVGSSGLQGCLHGLVVIATDLLMVQAGEHAANHRGVELHKVIGVDTADYIVDLAGVQSDDAVTTSSAGQVDQSAQAQGFELSRAQDFQSTEGEVLEDLTVVLKVQAAQKVAQAVVQAVAQLLDVIAVKVGDESFELVQTLGLFLAQGGEHVEGGATRPGAHGFGVQVLDSADDPFVTQFGHVLTAHGAHHARDVITVHA